MNAQHYKTLQKEFGSAEAHQKWLDKEKEEEEFEAKFQEMRKERSARAKKKLETDVLVSHLKAAGVAVISQVEKQKQEKIKELTCSITFELFKDPVILLGDGKTYEREAIEKALQVKYASPDTGLDLPDENQRILVPNWAARTACDALRDEPNPEGRSNEIPAKISTNETIKLLQEKIMELREIGGAAAYESGLHDGFENAERYFLEEQEYDFARFWRDFAEYMLVGPASFGDTSSAVPLVNPYASIIYKQLIDFEQFLTRISQTRIPGHRVENIIKPFEDQWENIKAQLPNNHPIITGVSLIEDPDDKYQEGLQDQQENVCVEVASFWKMFIDFSKERGTTQTIYEHLRLFEESVKDDDEISWIMNQMEALPPTPPPPDISRISLEDMPGRR